MNIIAFIVNLIMILFAFSFVMCIIVVIEWLTRKFLLMFKKIYIFINYKNITDINFSERQELYRKDHKQTGYSINRKYNSITEYYTIENVFDGYARNTSVYFKTGKKLTVILKENSFLYKKLKQ